MYTTDIDLCEIVTFVFKELYNVNILSAMALKVTDAVIE